MAKQLTIANEYIRVTISAQGAQMQSIIKDGKELLWEGDPAVWSGQAPVLFPICGGLKDDKYVFEGKEYTLKKHGFARNSEFEVETQEPERAVFLLRADEERLGQYPFACEFRVIYSLDKTKINVEYNVKNLSGKDMYFSFGAHEAYACPEGIEDYSVIFEVPEELNSNILNGNLLEYETVHIGSDVKELPLKYEYFAVDALVFLNLKSRKATLKNRKTGKEITVTFDGADYFLLWTKPGGKYICLEPWCGIQDFVDSDYDITKKPGIRKLSPDSVYAWKHSILF